MRTKRFLAVSLTAAFAVTLLFAAAAGAQVQVQQVQQQQIVTPQLAGVPAPPSGPLASEVVEVRDRDRNNRIDRGDILLIRSDCDVDDGASITVEDGNNTPNNPDDNTQGTFVDDQNATITTTDKEIEIEVNGEPIGVTPVRRNGDEVLRVRGVEVVTSTGVHCGGRNDNDDNNDDNNDTNDGNTNNDTNDTNNTDTTETTTAQDTTTPDTTTTDTTGDALETTTANNPDSVREADAFRCDFFLRAVRDDTGALRDQYQGDELIVQRFEQCLSEDVLADTIPDRRLPFTGGPMLGLAAIGLASLFAGASVLGAATRRRR